MTENSFCKCYFGEVTRTDGNTTKLDTAYLFVADGTCDFIYEVSGSGFFGYQAGLMTASDYAMMDTLTFFAEEEGTYIITLTLLAFDTNVADNQRPRPCCE